MVDPQHAPPRPGETLIEGEWAQSEGRVVANEQCKRIQWLIAHHLIKVATDSSGWVQLFRDPNDDRLWELDYPFSEMHGGGPPKLLHVPAEEAARRWRSF